jgi:hypothetical protein
MTTALLAQLMFTALTAIFSFTAALYWAKRKATQDKAAITVAEDAALHLRVIELESKLGILTQTIQPITAAFQAVLIKQLTHYHTPKLDALLAKIGPPSVLTRADEVELAMELDKRTKDMGASINASERLAATMLPFVMSRVRHEGESPPANSDFLIVRVPGEHE